MGWIFSSSPSISTSMYAYRYAADTWAYSDTPPAPMAPYSMASSGNTTSTRSNANELLLAIRIRTSPPPGRNGESQPGATTSNTKPSSRSDERRFTIQASCEETPIGQRSKAETPTAESNERPAKTFNTEITEDTEVTIC